MDWSIALGFGGLILGGFTVWITERNSTKRLDKQLMHTVQTLSHERVGAAFLSLSETVALIDNAATNFGMGHASQTYALERLSNRFTELLKLEKEAETLPVEALMDLILDTKDQTTIIITKVTELGRNPTSMQPVEMFQVVEPLRKTRSRIIECARAFNAGTL